MLALSKSDNKPSLPPWRHMWRPLLLCCPFVTWYLINPPVSLSLNKESSSPPVRWVYFRHIGQFIWWQGCGKVSWVPFLLHETPAKFLLQTSPSNTMSVEINFSITSAAAIIRSSEAQKGKRGKSVKEIYLLAKQLLPRRATHQSAITGSLSLSLSLSLLNTGIQKNIFVFGSEKNLIFAKSAREGSLPTHCPSASHGTILPQFSEPQTSLLVHPCTHQNGSAVKWFTLSMARISSRFHCTAGLQNFLSVVSARICHWPRNWSHA